MKKRKLLDLSVRVKDLRTRMNWTQGELADRVGVERPSVTMWETGPTKNIRNENLLALAEAFGMTVDEFLTGDRPAELSVGESPGSYQVHDSLDRLLHDKVDRLTELNKYRLHGYVDGLLDKQEQGAGGGDISINAEALQGEPDELASRQPKKNKESA